MNRVEIVNLGGRTHQIETDGASAIDRWLAEAAISLSDDPDREDLLADFERAIGEKCDAQVAGDREVVTMDQVTAILESLGTIEPSGDFGTAVNGNQLALVARPRRLFRLPDERVIAGVCSGVAAWLGIDVTVLRVAWAVLPVLMLPFTEGMSLPLAVGLYVVLALVLPKANSPESRAAARGRGTTAQDMLMQARSGAMPALSAAGRQLASLIRLALVLAKGGLLVTITALLAAWIVGAGWLAMAGESVLDAFGPGVSGWFVPLLYVCLAVVVVAPLAGGVMLLDAAVRATMPRQLHRGHVTTWILSLTAAWVIAIAMAVALVATIPGMRDLWSDDEARIYFMGTTYCFVERFGTGHCQPGDEIVNDEPPRRYETFPVLPPLPPTPLRREGTAAPLAPAAPAEGSSESAPTEPAPAEGTEPPIAVPVAPLN